MTQETETFNIADFNLTKYDELLSYGLSSGIGAPRPGEMCIEAVICNVLGLEHDDDPLCVTQILRTFKINLNDCSWSCNTERAKGLHDLGLAQLGSLGVVDGSAFITRLTEKLIRVLIPKLFREIFTDTNCLDAANRCELEGTGIAADAARYAADAARSDENKYLILAANLATEVLVELSSPGCALLGDRIAIYKR